MAALQYEKKPRFQMLRICIFADRAGNFSQYRTLASVMPGWRACLCLSMPGDWAPDVASLGSEMSAFRARRNWSVGSWTGGSSNGFRLALGDAGAEHFHPRRHGTSRIARDACRWWRDRGARDRQ